MYQIFYFVQSFTFSRFQLQLIISFPYKANYRCCSPLCSRVESLASGNSESVRVASDALSDAEVGVAGAVGESERPLRARRRPLPLLDPLPLPEPYGCSRPRPEIVPHYTILARVYHWYPLFRGRRKNRLRDKQRSETSLQKDSKQTNFLFKISRAKPS